MAGNAVNEKGFADGNPLAAMSGAMGNIQGMISNAQQQAQSAAQGGAAEGEAAGGAPTLASVQADWGSKFGGSGGSGGVNSSFALQDSGKNKGKGGSAPADMAQQMAAMQAQAQSMLESSRIRGRSSFGNTEGLGANRNATIGQGRRSGQGNIELEQVRKQSADIAANKNRAANEGSRPFLASTQLSGGVRVTKENFEANSTQGSTTDFNNSFSGNLGNIQNWGQEQIDSNEKRLKDYINLLLVWIGVTAGVLVALWIIPKLVKLAETLMDIPAYGAVAAAAVMAVVWVLAVLAILAATSLIVGAAQYAKDYGGGWLSTLAGLTGIALAGGVVISFFSNKIYDATSKVVDSVKTWMTSGQSTTIGEVLKGIWAAIVK